MRKDESATLKTLRARVLVVEDEADLREALVSFLNLAGFFAAGAGSAAEAEAWLNAEPVDVVLLDVGLPDADGIAWVASTQKHPQRGLIVTTARGELPDRLRGLAAGADAYLVKPVELEELRLVVLNVVRRLANGAAAETTGSEWTLDPVRWALGTPDGKTVKLTRSENSLLGELAIVPGKPVARDVLIRALGYEPETYDPRRMEILTRRLRNKVQTERGIPLPLETVHGFGYAFTAEISVTPAELPGSGTSVR